MLNSEMNHRVDLAVLRASVMPEDIDRAAAVAMDRGYAALVVAPVYVSRAARLLRGSSVKVCAAVGYPLGMNKPTLKAIEATSCIKDGAEEIEVVAHAPHLLRLDVDSARDELLEIVRAARATRSDVVVKVIVPTMVEDGIAVACQAIRESGCDCIVGADSEPLVRWMKQYASDAISVKATRIDLIRIGADRASADYEAGFSR